MPELSHRVQTFTDSVIRRMTRISDEVGAINLSQGFPDFPPPKAITDRLREVADEGPHQYPITFGAQNFREALARKRAVGHHHERRSEQLDNRFIVGADLLELFVAEDDACIQAGSAESQRNAGQLPRFRDSPADDA